MHESESRSSPPQLATQEAGTAGVGRPRKAAVFMQAECFKHRYIRSKDTSSIVERPERLRAVSIGLAAAIARLEESTREPSASVSLTTPQERAADDLAIAMARMDIKSPISRPPVSIIQSQSSVDLMNNPAVKFIHGDVDDDNEYPKKLTDWSKESWGKVSQGESEIPEGFSQGDLYLCPESIDAIQGALGAMCDAIDAVVASSNGIARDPAHRAFVAIRPPGHHCGEDSPCGFCFVNNVAVGAAHAHLQHNMKRIVILDIDLHHGNGTQSIAWQINEETYRQTLESEEGALPPTKPGPQIFYGSIHDILSFPCEDGKPDLVQAASVSIHNAHGQHIENVHLQTYTSEIHFWDVLYREQYSRILRKAEAFLDSTGGPGEDVMVFISCGMDACEHEYPSMSRHNRKVPTSFYQRFTRDTCALSDQYAGGRLVSVLEGGYSDRALISGSMAHLVGLVGGEFDESWWAVENLVKLEKATTKRRGGRHSVTAAVDDAWLKRTLELLPILDNSPAVSPRAIPMAPTSMSLRDRKKPPSAASSTSGTKSGGAKNEQEAPLSRAVPPTDSGFANDRDPPSAGKKLPRVVLRLGPPPNGP